MIVVLAQGVTLALKEPIVAVSQRPVQALTTETIAIALFDLQTKQYIDGAFTGVFIGEDN